MVLGKVSDNGIRVIQAALLALMVTLLFVFPWAAILPAFVMGWNSRIMSERLEASILELCKGRESER